jgi:hypothetical protein
VEIMTVPFCDGLVGVGMRAAVAGQAEANPSPWEKRRTVRVAPPGTTEPF